MSTKDTPTTTPLADAYVAACRSQNNLLVARWKWLRSDEERKYTFTTEWLWRPAPDTGSRLWHGRHPGQRCRPSELKEKLRAWVDTLGIALPSCNYWWVRARAIASELESQAATYWLICHAYPVHPRTGRADHGLLTEYILAVHPDVPSCIGYMSHDWKVVDPSARAGRAPGDRRSLLVCLRCGKRHEYREQADPLAPWPWQSYGMEWDPELA